MESHDLRRHMIWVTVCLLAIFTVNMCGAGIVFGQGTITVGAMQVNALVERVGSSYHFKNATISKYYSSAYSAIVAGLSSLTKGRTQNEILALRGTFSLTKTITLLSYTTIDMYNAVFDVAANFNSIFYSSYRKSIVIRGGTVDGNKRIAHAISFNNVNSFIIKDMVIAWTWSHSVYLVSSKNGYIRNVEASHAELINSAGDPVGQDGFVITKTSYNITLDQVYVHDIWMEYTPRPYYELWGGGVEIMTYPGAEPRNIRVLNSKFVHLGEFGVGISSNGLGLHVYNVEVANNTFRNIGKEAIDITYSINSVVKNNFINRTERYGIQIYAAGSYSDNIEVRGNTIINAGYLSGVTVAGINTDGNGNMTNLRMLSNTIVCKLGMRLTPRAMKIYVSGNDFSKSYTDVLTYATSVTWGTNVNEDGYTVTGKQP